MQELFYDILDERRKKILPLFKTFRGEFYLAGGTALALQIGHRDSVDFDFFTPKSFSTTKLFEKSLKVFERHKVRKIQEEKDTLTIIVDGKIKISFFVYPYTLINKTVNTGDMRIASIADIGCMKLSAIVSRATMKDYVDLLFVLRMIKLSVLLDYARRKFPTIDTNLILKGLVYFDDVEEEPLVFKHNNKVSFSAVKSFLCRKVKRYVG